MLRRPSHFHYSHPADPAPAPGLIPHPRRTREPIDRVAVRACVPSRAVWRAPSPRIAWPVTHPATRPGPPTPFGLGAPPSFASRVGPSPDATSDRESFTDLQP